MRRLIPLAALIAALALVGARALGRSPEETPAADPAFRAVDVILVSSEDALVAYQVEIRYDRERMKIVGLEGGAAAPFSEPPYYDPAGLTAGRIVIAALTTDDENAPRGRFRVARLHVIVEDGGAVPPLTTRLVTAARPGGDRITPDVEILPTEGR